MRFVLVPGLTDDAGDVAQIAKFAASLGNVASGDYLQWSRVYLASERPDPFPFIEFADSCSIRTVEYGNTALGLPIAINAAFKWAYSAINVWGRRLLRRCRYERQKDNRSPYWHERHYA